MKAADISVNVNGEVVKDRIFTRMSLLDFIRDRAGLTGTHTGCEHGVCGACSVIFEGQPVRSCSILAVQANGKSIITNYKLRFGL